jgi:amino acid transporter
MSVDGESEMSFHSTMSSYAGMKNYLGKLNARSKISRLDLFFLGINIVIGSCIDIDFSSGYWVLLFSMLLSGFGYCLLIASLAEMTSALPFSGGIYGIVRAFLHPFLGFVAACFELLINVFYIALAVRSFALLPIQAEFLPDEMFLVNCLVIYIIVLSICLLGGKVFWFSNTLIGVTCLAIILIYILGSAPKANFSHWKHTDHASLSFNEIMFHLPGPSLAFLGIQYLPLASKMLPDAKTDVPIVMISTIAVIFPLIIAVITVASSIAPGFDLLSVEDHPLIFGFSDIFDLQVLKAHLLGLPGLLSTCFSFMYCFGRQASTMAGSGLLPPICRKSLPIFGTPYFPLIFVTILSFVLNIVGDYYEEDVMDVYLDICCMSTYIVVISFFLAYIQFKRNYSSLQRSFTSPVGIAGAIVGICIFLLCFVSVLGFQARGYDALIVLIGLSVAIIIIFKVFLHGSHHFSEEEKNELFKAYLITANKATKNRLRKNNKVGPDQGSKMSHNSGFSASNFLRKNSRSLHHPSSRSAISSSKDGDSNYQKPPPTGFDLLQEDNLTSKSKVWNEKASDENHSPPTAANHVVDIESQIAMKEEETRVPTISMGATTDYLSGGDDVTPQTTQHAINNLSIKGLFQPTFFKSVRVQQE